MTELLIIKLVSEPRRTLVMQTFEVRFRKADDTKTVREHVESPHEVHASCHNRTGRK